VVVIARWQSAAATLESVGGCAKLPPGTAQADARSLVARALAQILRGIDGSRFAALLALDAPVAAVAALDTSNGRPGLVAAASVGLTSADGAIAAAEASGALSELGPGLLLIHADDSSPGRCALAAAAGAAPVRLVCGLHDRDIVSLGPYLARTVPVAAAPPVDFRAELRFAPVEGSWGGDLRKVLALMPMLAHVRAAGEPKLMNAVDEASAALSTEGIALLTELDHATLDVSADASLCLHASASFTMSGKTSWLGRTIAELAPTAPPPPAIFWRAPIDSTAATYGRGAVGDRLKGILRVLRDAAEGGLARERIGSAADRKALAALLTVPIGKDTAYVIASGPSSPGAPPVPAPSSASQIAPAPARSVMGFELLGFDEGPAGPSKMFNDVIGALSRKALRDAFERATGSPLPFSVVAKLVRAPKELGPGALAAEIRVFADEKDKERAKDQPVVVHALLMGEPHATWIIVGANRDDLLARLLACKSDAPEPGTLAARPGLEPLRTGSALAGGYVTAGAVTSSLAAALRNLAVPLVGTDLARTLESLPNKGETPIFIASNATAEGPRVDLSLNIGSGSLEDAGVFFLAARPLAVMAGFLSP
jgi:hypothetical protein